MENDITKDQVDKTLEFFQDWSNKLDNSIIREPQHVSEFLPLVLYLLKEKKDELEQIEKEQKFYAPAWVYTLLNHLSTSKEPISQVEYKHYQNEVSKLSFNDFKPATPGVGGYIVKYTNPKEISELILALKNYFHLL